MQRVESDNRRIFIIIIFKGFSLIKIPIAMRDTLFKEQDISDFNFIIYLSPS